MQIIETWGGRDELYGDFQYSIEDAKRVIYLIALARKHRFQYSIEDAEV